MFERYTDRAKRAVELAQEGAADLGHDAVGTEHLLLGLIGEGGGVAFKALSELGVTTEAANEAVRRRHQAGDARPSGGLPYTPRLKKTLELALREAILLGHNFIATEHLLLGLAREGADTGAAALADCGIAHGDKGFLADVRAKVLELLRGYAEAEKREADGQERAALDVGKLLAENPRFNRRVRQFVTLLDAAEVLGDLKPPNSDATAFYLRSVAEGLMRETSLGEEFLQAMIAGRPSVYEAYPDEPQAPA
jgi:ATP-dependent Clp protease ATP-binding subunit ClpA